MSITDKTQQMLILTQKIKELIITENIPLLLKINSEFNLLYKPIDANNLSMLHFAVQMNKINIVSQLANLMSHSQGLEVKDIFGRTPLHQAAAKGNINIIQILILNNADVNACTVSGETPLMKAISFFQIKAIYLLLRSGANPYMINQVTGMNCFEQANETRNKDIISLFDKYKDVYKTICTIQNVADKSNKKYNDNIFRKFDNRILKRVFSFLIPW